MHLKTSLVHRLLLGRWADRRTRFKFQQRYEKRHGNCAAVQVSVSRSLFRREIGSPYPGNQRHASRSSCGARAKVKSGVIYRLDHRAQTASGRETLTQKKVVACPWHRGAGVRSCRATASALVRYGWGARSSRRWSPLAVVLDRRSF
jgi:hypothetical protein